MDRPPIILSVAGSDPSGGAGLQADLQAIAANGGFAVSAVAALTVQNSRGVRSVHPLAPELVGDQMQAVLEDTRVDAVKTGMLGTGPNVDAVCSVLRRYPDVPLVVDPVVAPTRGVAVLDPEGVEALRTRLLPRADLLTPNVPEAELLAGTAIRDEKDAAGAGYRLLEAGAKAVLVKGGHLADSPGTDVLVTKDGTVFFRGTWREHHHGHGTGCVLSAAIATWLGKGANLEEAVRKGRAYLDEALQAGFAVGEGEGCVDPLFVLKRGFRA